jgi:cyanophycin synthetase
LLDYAHNAHGIHALGQYVSQVRCTCKTGVIAGIGDRRDEDLVAIGKAAAGIFDKIIVRNDTDLRGRSADEINRLVCEGIESGNFPGEVSIVPDELLAVKYALAQAVPGSLIVLLIDDLQRVKGLLKETYEQRQMKEVA